MSRENIIKFYEAIENSPKLQKKMQKIKEKKAKKDINEQIVKLAGKNNIYFTKNELINYFEAKDKILKDNDQKVNGERNFSKGEIAAAKVARKSIVNSAQNLASANYKETYKDD